VWDTTPPPRGPSLGILERGKGDDGNHQDPTEIVLYPLSSLCPFRKALILSRVTPFYQARRNILSVCLLDGRTSNNPD